MFCLLLYITRKQCISISCLPNLASNHLYADFLSASSLLHLPRSAAYLSAIIMLLPRFNEDQLYLSIRPWGYLLIFHLITISAKSGSWQLRFFVITDAIRSNLFTNFVDAYMHPSRVSREFRHWGLISVRRSRAPWTSTVRYNIGRKRKAKINDLSIFRSLFLAPRIQLILSMCNTSQYSLRYLSPFSISFFERWRFDSLSFLELMDLG